MTVLGHAAGNTVEQNVVLFYAGEFGYFMSNFSAFQIWNDRCSWATSEHAYQAAKFADQMHRNQIRLAKSAHDALKLARRFEAEGHLRSDWDEAKKLQVMREIVQVKHDQHEPIQKWLRRTGDAVLIEDSPKDAFWVRGPDWRGRNELGKIWMALRMEKYGT